MAGPHAGNRNRPAYSGQSRFRFPKQIIELFAPRPPLKFKPPPRGRRLPPMTGVAAYVKLFGSLPPVDPSQSERKDKPTAAENDGGSTKSRVANFETPAQIRARKRAAQTQKARVRVEKEMQGWHPKGNAEKKTGNAYRTLFVSGFALDTVEMRLRAEFDSYGDVVQVIMPRDRRGVPRGYAFIEFDRESALKAAYKDARGRKIDGRRIQVDVERGRTVAGWRPNRLDGPNNAAAAHKAEGRPM